MLATLLVLAGGLAASPYWIARAQTTQIYGAVRQCNATGPSFLTNVAVSLIDAHSAQSITTSTDSAGVYNFTNPSTGSYILRFVLGEYYTRQSAAPFRYDGSISLRVDACLDKMPSRITTLTVLVVNTLSTAHFGEGLSPARFTITRENGAGAFNSSTNIVTVAHQPVVHPGSVVRWSTGSGDRLLSDGREYNWTNLFTGQMLIGDPGIIASLTAGSTDKWLNVSYQWSATTTTVAFPPVVPGSYIVWKNTTSWMPEENVSWKLDPNKGVFTFLGNFIFGTDNASISYSSAGVVSGATVNLFNATRSQVVASGRTDGTGFVTLSIWGAPLELQVQADQYQPVALTVDTTTVNSTRVVLSTGFQVFGHAIRSGGGFVSAGLVGFLYNMNPAASLFRKVLSAKVQSSLYIFYAEPGQTYQMVIDADGYRAGTVTVVTSPGTSREVDMTLTPSLKEEYRTNVTYDDTDWNTPLTVARKFTLRPDSTIPGLLLPGIRSVALQIDYTLGDKNGILTGPEAAALGTWLESRLADYVTTSGFLGTNGVPYNSTATSYVVSGPNFQPNLLTATAIFINTTATYRVVAPNPTIPNGKDTYYVNVTVPNDTNTTGYQDHVVVVNLPRGYEMVSKKVTGSITTTGWTAVTVDPGQAPGTSEIDMTVRRSRNGTALAMVTGPAGKYHTYDSDADNWTAIVAANANISFSASQSTDPVGNINDANFTWKFKNTTDPAQIRWGIDSVFNYTQSGRYTVNLTLVQAGGNATYRDIYVYVDDTSPVAVIKDNKTSPAFGVNVNGTTLEVNQDDPVRFDGFGSSDIVFNGANINWDIKVPDVEGNRGYEWDYQGDGIVDSSSVKPPTAWPKPGTFNMTLVVVDWVGHKSVPAKLTVIVNDTKGPSPNFVMLDPAHDWVVVTGLTEGKEYVFNASSSTDNYDSSENLTYGWHFPGAPTTTPVIDGNGNFTGRGAQGWNITVSWAVFNVSYNVTLNVTDTGFGSAKPNSANRTVSVAVSVDQSKHPDLQVVPGSLRFNPSQPTEGQAINVSFEILNLENRANASGVKITLYARDSAGALVATYGDPQWLTDAWASAPDKVITAGEKVRLIFTVSFASQGNKTIQVYFNDTAEPYTWVDAQNRVTGTVFVSLASWVIPAYFVAVIAIIALVAIGYRMWSRYKAGEPLFPRREKKEKKKLKGEEEEEEAEAEDKRGKKRL
ncbi:MAG: hypothetical protein A3K65_02915 [Euryarchaeota archaeon RBG_16_68_12]|nr:MAG: hypothetical protein A3K65_02915 [Euryarchaeota archaeon RBG_16_68_12]